MDNENNNQQVVNMENATDNNPDNYENLVGYDYVSGKNRTIYRILIISIIICMFSCFLPIYKIDSSTLNYVYNSYTGRILDGIFILIFGSISLLFLLIGKKKRKVPVLIFQLLSFGIFAYDFFREEARELNKYLSEFYGIGYYLLLVFLIISVILALIRVIKKDTYY